MSNEQDYLNQGGKVDFQNFLRESRRSGHGEGSGEKLLRTLSNDRCFVSQDCHDCFSEELQIGLDVKGRVDGSVRSETYCRISCIACLSHSVEHIGFLLSTSIQTNFNDLRRNPVRIVSDTVDTYRNSEVSKPLSETFGQASQTLGRDTNHRYITVLADNLQTEIDRRASSPTSTDLSQRFDQFSVIAVRCWSKINREDIQQFIEYFFAVFPLFGFLRAREC